MKIIFEVMGKIWFILQSLIAGYLQKQEPLCLLNKIDYQSEAFVLYVFAVFLFV